MLEMIMFCAPFPTIHIEHMSSVDISLMCSSGFFGLNVFTPRFIAFEEQLYKESESTQLDTVSSSGDNYLHDESNEHTKAYSQCVLTEEKQDH
jgi:hypothetical protein